MTLRDLLENALIGAVTLENKLEQDQIRDLMRVWKREYETDVDLINFAQAYPDRDPDLPF